MKRLFINLTVLGIVALMCASCSKDAMENSIEPEETFTVKLGIGGEFKVDYEELTKVSGDDLYGIQVYSTPDIEGATTLTPYAYGLFDDPAGIEITLLKGYKYKFVATLIKNGKNKLYKYSNNGFSSPFFVYGTESEFCEISNNFSYDATKKYNSLGDGNTRLSNNQNYNRPNTDRYYGEYDNYIPGSNNENVTINMKRASYGAKFIVQGNLATSGKLQVLMTESPSFEFQLTNAQEDDTYSDIYTFSNVYAAWNSTDENRYTETVLTTVNWCREDGTIIPLGSHEIVFKRNQITTITVKINSDESNAGFGFDIEEGEMGEGNNVTIDDGEII